MASSETSNREEDLSKKDRLINAWLAVGPEAKGKNVAEITDSSVAYASRVQSEMEEAEISEEEVEEVRDEQLMDEYANRLEQLTQEEQEANGGVTEETSQAETGGEETQEQSEESQESRQRPQGTPQQQPQQRQQQQVQQQPPRQQQPPQPPRQQPRQPSQPPQQQTQRDFPSEDQQTVSVQELQELDTLLATYEEEAQFEIQNLPPEHNGNAVGKLFVAQKTRSLLREIVGNGQGSQTQ